VHRHVPLLEIPLKKDFLLAFLLHSYHSTLSLSLSLSLFLSRARARYRYFSFRVSVFAHSSRIFSDLLKRYIIFSSNSIRAIDSNLLAKCPKWIQQGCSFDWNVILYSCS